MREMFDIQDVKHAIDAATEGMYHALRNKGTQHHPLRVAMKDDKDPSSIYCGVTERRGDYADKTLAFLNVQDYSSWRGIARDLANVVCFAMLDVKTESEKGEIESHDEANQLD